MSRYNHHTRLEAKDYFYRIGASIATIAILVLCMPGEGYNIFNYSYSVGEPWDYSTIIAKDSFPVLKSEETLMREKDSLKNYYEPYFRIEQTVKEQQIVAFTKDFKENLQGQVPTYYLKHLIDKLSELYDHGVMATDDYEKLKTEKTRYVRVFAQNESSARSVQNLYTAKSGYEFLMSEEDSTRYNHAMLLRCNLSRFVSCNLTYDVTKSEQQREEIDNMLVPYMGQVQVGQKIVAEGDIVDEYTYNVLRSMEQYQLGRTKSTTEKLSITGGHVIYAMLMVLLLLFYFEQFRSDYLREMRYPCLVLSMFILFPLATYSLVSNHLMSVYVIPYCIMPIFVRVFMDSRTAFITHLITILTCAVVLKNPFDFILVQTTAGLVAIYSLQQLSQRSDLFRACVFVIAASVLSYFCLELIHSKIFSNGGVDKWTYIYLCIAGVLSLIAYQLLIPIERIFGFTSNVTLVELSNINNTVLRRLSEEAPGTFQHSMQVANLAAEIANKIGAKSQLVRTGALYHDIGKLENPVFFTENQNSTNPHDGITYVQSARIIIQHVDDGLKLADKYKLPLVVRQFISTHHGTSMTKYFYVSFKNKFPDQPVDKSLFTYPGPNPSTQEQAILMMADAVEAASRSLSGYTEESIGNLVDKIVDEQVKEGYFNDCPITFLDIQKAKEVLKTKLTTIYHTRIQYPELK